MIETIKAARNIVILPHKSPDGDCLGSAYGLKLMLMAMGKQAKVWLEESGMPKLCQHIYGTEEKAPFETADLMIAVDSGDLGRLGSRSEAFSHFQNTINIDHHPTNIGYGKVNWVEPQASATGELIFRLGEQLGVMNAEIAHNLYLAISSDTGGFRQSNTTPETMELAARLMRYSIDAGEINRILFSCYSPAEISLLGLLYSSVEQYFDNKVSLIALEPEALTQTGADDEDVGKFSHIPRQTEGCEVSFFIRRKETGEVKVSLRSNGAFDVSKFAAQFGGGGHKRASGCEFQLPVNEVKKLLLEKIQPLL